MKYRIVREVFNNGGIIDEVYRIEKDFGGRWKDAIVSFEFPDGSKVAERYDSLEAAESVLKGIKSRYMFEIVKEVEYFN